MSCGLAADEHNPGWVCHVLLADVLLLKALSVTFQKKPGGNVGEMETITILTYQSVIELELSTPSR